MGDINNSCRQHLHESDLLYRRVEGYYEQLKEKYVFFNIDDNYKTQQSCNDITNSIPIAVGT